MRRWGGQEKDKEQRESGGRFVKSERGVKKNCRLKECPDLEFAPNPSVSTACGFPMSLLFALENEMVLFLLLWEIPANHSIIFKSSSLYFASYSLNFEWELFFCILISRKFPQIDTSQQYKTAGRYWRRATYISDKEEASWTRNWEAFSCLEDYREQSDRKRVKDKLKEN